MITNAQEKLIRNLLTKKGRRAEGLCLAEGRKLVSDIMDFVDFTVSPEDTRFFDEFTDTQTPQNILAVARIPKFDEATVLGGKQIVFLDHVQDPGNVGAFFRLALAFDATLILRECADPYSPKVVRASAGASFRVPNIECNIEEGKVLLQKSGRKVLKFELNEGAIPFDATVSDAILMFGNEGNGIMGDYEGQSVFIKHNPALESLSVGHAGAIAMHNVYAAK
jgi:TrmH family RNA methyltransferase